MKRICGRCVGFVFFFLFGLIFQRFKLPPYEQLHDLRVGFQSFVWGSAERYESKKFELMDGAFADPLISSEKVYPPIQSSEKVRELNEGIFVPIDRYFNAYSDMEIDVSEELSLDNGRTKVVKVNYQLWDKVYDSYAYGPIESEKDSSSAVLIIPGSGYNQSSEIYYYNNIENYHYGILDTLNAKGDVFVYIKPNQDILAFHDGKNKLSKDYYINWHLNRGGSYSASYITQSMAFVKFLKSKYKKVIVVGLSQGGRATLLNALQSEPDMAIVSSGYSVLEDEVEPSGYNQIIIPKISVLYSQYKIRDEIEKLKTSFLFSYGKEEKGVYGIEARDMSTCSYFKDVKNIKCIIFQGGHQFPISEISNFLKNEVSE